MDTGFVNSPAVFLKPVVFWYECDVVMTVPFHIQAVGILAEIESVYQRLVYAVV